MVSILTAIAIASGSEVVDAGRIRGGSCANGQCSAVESVQPVVVSEKKEAAAGSCASSCESNRGGRKINLFGRLRGGCR